VDDAHAQLKNEEARHVVVVKTLVMAEKKIKDLGTKLTEADREKKSIEAALADAVKQAKDQCLQLRRAEEQLAIAHEQFEAQKKELEKKEEVLEAQVTGVYQDYCLQVWTEALNLAGVGASSDLRKTENIFYPSALRIAAPPASQATTVPKVPTTAQPAGKASTTASSTTKAFAAFNLLVWVPQKPLLNPHRH